MRLAFIKKKFSVHGGAERYLQTFLGQLAGSGHELHVYASRWDGGDTAVFHHVPHVSCGSLVSVASFNRNVRRVIALGPRPDCVISFERTNCQDIYRAGEGCHAEWLRIRRTVDPLFKRLSFAVNPFHRYMLDLERRIFTDTPLIVANSRMVGRQIMDHYGISEGRIRVVYNGVDLERFHPAGREIWRSEIRSRYKIPEEALLLLFVGSGFARKGLLQVVRAFKRLDLPDLYLLAVGKGDPQEALRLVPDERIRSRIIVAGPQKEIEMFYGAADIFVLPTLYDPFSNATIEAMAAALPVITTCNNGVAELIENGREGYVLGSCSDANELAEAIRLVMSNHEAMGRHARARAALYPVAEAVGNFVRLVTAGG
jgi:UDP-glucose:(heptosyl)LPS alpha-1,3-glucosyltransferase